MKMYREANETKFSFLGWMTRRLKWLQINGIKDNHQIRLQMDHRMTLLVRSVSTTVHHQAYINDEGDHHSRVKGPEFRLSLSEPKLDLV